jgi:hypothetical protein
MFKTTVPLVLDTAGLVPDTRAVIDRVPLADDAAEPVPFTTIV